MLNFNLFTKSSEDSMWNFAFSAFCGRKERRIKLFLFAPWSIYVDLLRSLYIKLIYDRKLLLNRLIFLFIELLLFISFERKQTFK